MKKLALAAQIAPTVLLGLMPAVALIMDLITLG